MRAVAACYGTPVYSSCGMWGRGEANGACRDLPMLCACDGQQHDPTQGATLMVLQHRPVRWKVPAKAYNCGLGRKAIKA